MCWELGGVLILLAASFKLLQSRYALIVQAFWLVLRTSPIHGSVLPSNPGRGRGWSCYIHFLLLHTSPMKVNSCCAGSLACFKYLSCSWGWGRLTSNPERKRGVGVIIITPLLNATPCFAGPLACFRYIVHLWNVENEMNQ